MEGIFEVFDEYESDVNGLRTRGSLRQVTREGFFPGSRPPFGYRAERVKLSAKVKRRQLVPHPDEPEIAAARSGRWT